MYVKQVWIVLFSVLFPASVFAIYCHELFAGFNFSRIFAHIVWRLFNGLSYEVGKKEASDEKERL